jgi:hypothetical protein
VLLLVVAPGRWCKLLWVSSLVLQCSRWGQLSPLWWRQLVQLLVLVLGLLLAGRVCP